MADWNDPATWAQAYSKRGGRPNKTDSVLPTGAGFGQHLSYLDGRTYALQLADDGASGLSHFRFELNKLGAVPAFTPSTDVLVVGCGFGGLVEVMLDLGSNAAWGTDLSTVIHDNLATSDMPQEVQGRVLQINIEDADAADQFQAAGAGTNQGEFRWLVTEHVLEDRTGPQITAILDACDALRAPGQGGVAHIIISTDSVMDVSQMDPVFFPSPRTLAEWAALRPAHWWLDVTGAIAGGQ